MPNSAERCGAFAQIATTPPKANLAPAGQDAGPLNTIDKTKASDTDEVVAVAGKVAPFTFGPLASIGTKFDAMIRFRTVTIGGKARV